MEKNPTYSNLKSVLKVCYLFGIAAPFGNTIIYKIIIIWFLIISMAAYVHSVLGKMSDLFKEFFFFIKLTDQASSFFLTLTVEIMIILNIFIFGNKFKNYLLNMVNLDNKLKMELFLHGKAFWLYAAIVECSKVLIIGMDAYAWISTVGFETYKYYIIRGLQYYKLNINIFLVFWITLEIRKRFYIINTMLKNCLMDIVTDVSLNETGDGKPPVPRQIKDLIRLHNQLCDILDQHNQIWGIVIMFSTIFMIIYIVQYTAILIHYSIMGGLINGHYFGMNFRVSSCSWIIFNFVSICYCYIILVTMFLTEFDNCCFVETGTISEWSYTNLIKF